MEDLPKIVQWGLRKAAGSSGAANSPGAEHPDANLLTAFAERTLSESERARLMNHLAACPECREVIALASRPGVEADQPAVLAHRRPSWLVFPAVRWAAAAAALAAIITAIVLHRPTLQKPPETTIAQSKQPPVPPRRIDEAEPRTSQAPADKLGSGFAARRPTPTARLSARVETPSKAESANSAVRSAGAVSTPSNAMRNAPAPEAVRAQQEVVSPGPPVAEASREQPLAGFAPNKSAEAGPGAVAMKPNEPALSVTVPAAPINPKAKRARSEGSTAKLASAGLTAGKGQPGAMAAHWSISASGRVERSLDGGATWQELRVSDAGVFHAVAAAGEEVWAGGSKGSLYHSSDGGDSWDHVTISSNGTVLADTIVGISFPDAMHVTITTALDEKWVTTDGGREWEKQ